MEDKYLVYGFGVLILLVISYGVYGFWFSQTDSILSLPAVSSGSTDSGDVSIALTPIKVENGRLYISIAANTHSVDLSQFNLEEIISLSYDGKSTKPAEASRLSGHHTSGELVFPVKGSLNGFTITILGVPKISERRFEWRS